MTPQVSVHLDDELRMTGREVHRVLLTVALFAERVHVPAEFLINNRGLQKLYEKDGGGRELIEYLLGERVIVPLIGDQTPTLAAVLERQRQAGTIRIPYNPDFAESLDRVRFQPHIYSVAGLHDRFERLVQRLFGDEQRLTPYGFLSSREEIMRELSREVDTYGRISRSSFFRLARKARFKPIAAGLRTVGNVVKDLAYCDLISAQLWTPRDISVYLGVIEEHPVSLLAAESQNLLAALDEPRLEPDDCFVESVLLRELSAGKVKAADIDKLRRESAFQSFVQCISGEVGPTNPTNAAIEYLRLADDVLGLSHLDRRYLDQYWRVRTRLRYITYVERALFAMDLLSAGISEIPFGIGLAAWLVNRLLAGYRTSEERKLDRLRCLKQTRWRETHAAVDTTPRRGRRCRGGSRAAGRTPGRRVPRPGGHRAP